MAAQPYDSEVQTEAALAMGTLALARLTGLGTASAAGARSGLSLFASGALERLRAGDADAAAAAAAGAGAGAPRGGQHARAAAEAAAETARVAAHAQQTQQGGSGSAGAHAALDALVNGRGLVAARQRIAAELLQGLKPPV
jgi:hypothetical protein